jgi:hypothetical protein
LEIWVLAVAAACLLLALPATRRNRMPLE